MAATVAATTPMIEQNVASVPANADIFGVIPLQEGVSTISITSSKQINKVCHTGEVKIPCKTQTFTNAKLTCEFYDLMDTDKVEHKLGYYGKTHMKLLAKQENVLECKVHTNKLPLPMPHSLVIFTYNVEDTPVTMDLRITNKK